MRVETTLRLIDRDASDCIIELAGRLMKQTPVSMETVTPYKLPPEAGVYGFFRRTGDLPIYFGEAVNLRQRIYNTQFQGTLRQSAIKRYLRRRIPLELSESDKDYQDRLKRTIKKHLQVRFLPVVLGRIEVEDYLNRCCLSSGDDVPAFTDA